MTAIQTAQVPSRASHHISIPTRFVMPGDIVRLGPQIAAYLTQRLDRPAQTTGPLSVAVDIPEAEEERLRNAIEGLAREVLHFPDASVIDVTPPIKSSLRGGDLLRALAAGGASESVRSVVRAAPSIAMSVQRVLEQLQERGEQLHVAAGKIAAVDFEAISQRLAQLEAAVQQMGERVQHEPPLSTIEATIPGSLQRELQRLANAFEELSARGRAADGSPDHGAAVRLAALLRVVLRDLSAKAEEVGRVAVELKAGSCGPPVGAVSVDMQAELRRLGDLVESARRPSGGLDTAPDRDALLRLTAALRLVLRQLSERADDVGAVVERLSSAQAAADASPGRTSPEAPDWRAELLEPAPQRLLVGMGRVLRQLENQVETVGAAAADAADKVEALSGESDSAKRMEAQLDRLGELVARLEVKAPEPGASAATLPDWTPEQDSMRRLSVGFGLALKELRAGIAEVGEAAAEVRAKAETLVGPDSGPVSAEIAALRGEMAALSRAVGELRKGPAPTMLEAERTRLHKVLAGFTTVLRRLDELAPLREPSVADAAVEAAGLRKELTSLALAFQEHARLVEKLVTPSGAAMAEQGLEQVADRVVQRLQATFAEGMAVAMRDRAQSATEQRVEAGHGSALQRLAERVERLHQDLDRDTGRLGAALREAGSASPESAAVLESLNARFAETQAFVTEVLNVAAALSRDLDRAAEPAKPVVRTRLRGGLR